MSAPLDEALGNILRLAEEERIVFVGKAPGQIDALGYSPEDVYDAVWSAAANPRDWLEEPKYEERSHWPPYAPVITFRLRFQPAANDEEAVEPRPTDDLFLEVKIMPDRLHLLACKLDGSPQ